MEVSDAIKKRYSARSYSTRKINFDAIAEILEAAQHTPMAGNIFTLRLIVVSSAEIIQKLAEASQQEFISTAPYIIVVCSDNTQLVRSYGERAERYSRQQAGAAIQNMLLVITDLGLVSCWIGAFDDNAVKRILHVPDNVEVEALLPVAFKGPLREFKKKKFDLKNMVFFDRYGQKVAKPWKVPEAV